MFKHEHELVIAESPVGVNHKILELILMPICHPFLGLSCDLVNIFSIISFVIIGEIISQTD